jgi:hypothetical protein
MFLGLVFLAACTNNAFVVSDTDPPAADDSEVGADSSVEESVDSETSPVDSPVDDTEIDDSPGGGDTEDEPEEPPSWRSALYPESWTPEFSTTTGLFLHDFSYAGYRSSEVTIPDVTGIEYSVTAYGADASGASDSTAAIQAAIDAAEVEGGIVLFPAGEYRVDGLLTVNSSNVVLRGMGVSSSKIRFTRSAGMTDVAHLTFRGSVSESGEQRLVANGDPRSLEIRVDDASGFAPGDVVHVGWKITEDFTADHGMTGIWVSFTNQWKAFFRRTVVAVDTSVVPHRITLDIPLRYVAKMRDQASIRKANGYLREVGLEDLAVTTVSTWANAWANDRTHAIAMQGVMDGWVRRVSSYAPTNPPDDRGDQLMSGGLKIVDSRRITVADTHFAEAQHRGVGGNGYLFEISRSGEILTRDSSAKAGRHNFIQNWDFGTSGCVWLRTRSEDGRSLVSNWDPIGYASYSEYHHSLAMANLVDDSYASDGWQGVNRRNESSGSGHSATQNVFWNLTGGGYLRSLQYGMGYVIGPVDMNVHVDPNAIDWNRSGEGTAPEDWVEERDDGLPLEPRSLFEDQLRRRLAE